MHTLLCGANDLLCSLGHANECRATALVGNSPCRASHINIYAIKSQFTDDVGGFVKVFGPTAKDLCYNGAFCRCIQEIAKDAIAAPPESLNVCKLSEDDIRASIETMHRAAWR